MDAELNEKVNRKHVGRNVQKIRVYMGLKQEALAMDLGISQQEISKIEKQDEIEEGLLSQIAGVLGVSPEVIRDFDVEKAIYNINNSYKDATISEGATTYSIVHKDATISEGGTAIVLQVNPIDKIVELYERLLQSEREKIELLKNK